MATPLKQQFPLDPGTELAGCTCRACNGPVLVMVSKTQTAYYNCYNSDGAGRPCHHHERWGGVDSRDMRRKYHEKHGLIAPVKVPKEAANLNRPPIRPVEDAPADPKPAPEAANDNHEPAKPAKRSALDEYGY